MSDRFLDLVLAYQMQVRTAMALFRQHRGLEEPASWRSAGLKRQGFIDPDETIDYSFHGIGCRVTLPEGEVDWDFMQAEDLIGLKAWFIYRFALVGTDRFPDFREYAVVQKAFEEAIDRGVIKRHPDNGPDGDQFVLQV